MLNDFTAPFTHATLPIMVFTLCTDFPFFVNLLQAQEISCRRELPNINKPKLKRPSSVCCPKEGLERSKPARRQISHSQAPSKSKPDMTAETILPALLLRFPQALAEINRRLVSQNLLWFTLDRRSISSPIGNNRLTA